MPVSPTGPLSLHLDAVQRMLVASASFRAWVGAGTSDDAETIAAAHVHLVGVPPPEGVESFDADTLAAMRPLAVVNFDLREPFVWHSAAREQFVPSGRVRIAFEQSIPPEDARNFKEAVFAFTNALGSIVEEMQATSEEEGGYPVIQTISLLMPPTRAAPTEVAARGDYLACVVALAFGLNAGH